MSKKKPPTSPRPPRTAKGVRARKYYAAAELGNSRQQWFTASSKHDDKIFCDFTRPISVLDRSPAAQETLTEQAAKEIYESSPSLAVSPWDCAHVPTKNSFRRIARRVLQSCGLLDGREGK